MDDGGTLSQHNIYHRWFSFNFRWKFIKTNVIYQMGIIINQPIRMWALPFPLSVLFTLCINSRIYLYIFVFTNIIISSCFIDKINMYCISYVLCVRIYTFYTLQIYKIPDINLNIISNPSQLNLAVVGLCFCQRFNSIRKTWMEFSN